MHQCMCHSSSFGLFFAVIASVMCYRSCRRKEHNTTELRKNLGVLVLLFTFLGLPWLFVVTLFIIYNRFGVTFYVAFIFDVLQGPALFLIRAVRLKEVRQFWRRVLCSKPAQTRNLCHRCLA